MASETGGASRAACSYLGQTCAVSSTISIISDDRLIGSGVSRLSSGRMRPIKAIAAITNQHASTNTVRCCRKRATSGETSVVPLPKRSQSQRPASAPRNSLSATAPAFDPRADANQ